MVIKKYAVQSFVADPDNCDYKMNRITICDTFQDAQEEMNIRLREAKNRYPIRSVFKDENEIEAYFGNGYFNAKIQVI